MSLAWIIAGILLAAMAQLGLRHIAQFAPLSREWLIGIVFSLGFYGLAFLAYSFILRHHKITVAGPLMTIGVVALVVTGGLLMGETISSKQFAGLLLVSVAVWLLLS
jgi:drug/metabolite transporter (DMT)-like permease